MSVFRNLKISQKILVLIIVSSLFLTGVGFIGLYYMNQMADRTSEMFNNRLLPTKWIGQVMTNNRKVDAFTLELLVTTDHDRNIELIDSIAKSGLETNDILKNYEKISFIPEEEKIYKEFKLKLKELRDTRQGVLDLAKENKNSEAYAIYNREYREVRIDFNSLLEELFMVNEKAANKLEKENAEAANKIRILLVIIIILSILFSVSVGFLISRMIAKPLQEIKDLFGKAEQGDFTVKGTYESKDELGVLTESFNKMIGGLNDIIRTVSETAQQLAASSEELSASSEQSNSASEHIATTIENLAGGSEHQVRSVEDSYNAIKEITNHTEQIAENTSVVSATVNQTTEKSREGKQSIEKVKTQMNTINQNVNGLSAAVSALNERSQEIGKFNAVITDIAAQTNLLALNAAIEAARAGEHGRGFSVVAEEVKKLAEQSASSAEQINQLISIIQSENKNTLDSMKVTATEVDAGLYVVEEAGSVFNQIEEMIQEIVLQTQGVEKALNQLVSGTENVNDSMKIVNEVAEASAAQTQAVSAATEEQLASIQEITASSAALAKMAEELQNIVVQFKI
ncbi:methyl-accepting chemotaxis protein [Cytobacillus massiliigabonensis]|uniref:methyl-accepting chemotaxis protein n=1 Tax=Cytobacillus massiliigabonensis TaxID=1871011 RepID=UPI000C860A0E|nr:methyl-accepting chemotaxis protein [Cytobacillus massiliigabonensis]